MSVVATYRCATCGHDFASHWRGPDKGGECQSDGCACPWWKLTDEQLRAGFAEFRESKYASGEWDRE